MLPHKDILDSENPSLPRIELIVLKKKDKKKSKNIHRLKLKSLSRKEPRIENTNPQFKLKNFNLHGSKIENKFVIIYILFLNFLKPLIY